MTPARILVVEDDRVVARDIEQQLLGMGLTVVGVAARADDAVALAREHRPGLVLMDVRLEGGSDGIDAAARIRAEFRIPVIFLTAYADEETLRRASLAEPYGYLVKPFEDSQLRTAIELALYKQEAVQKIRDSEHRFEVTLSSIADAVIATDSDGRIAFMNPVAEALTGWVRSDALGQPLDVVFRIVSEQTRAPLESPASRVRRFCEPQKGAHDIVLVSKGGRDFLIDESAAPILSETGGIVGVVLVFRDASPRRQAEQAATLGRANAYMRRALEGSNVGVWTFDMPDGILENARTSFVNFWNQYGFDPTETITFADIVERWHPEDRERVVGAIRAYLAGETANYEIVCRMLDTQGGFRWRLVRGAASRDQSGKAIQFTGSSVDITDRKALEEQLLRAKDAAEAASKAKDEFLANVSHEIRTPMNAILGMTDLMLDTPLNADQNQLLRTVKSAAGGLLAIINDLLDFSKIEAGMLVLDRGDFFLRATLGEVMRALAMRAHRKGIELICQVHPDVPDALQGDAGRLRQVLINLVGNAIKFTARGEVVLDASIVDVPVVEGDVVLRFSVRDTGIGIPRDKQAMIFRAFEQEDMSTTRKYGGTGLGLTIAARLVGMMGGEITVDSTPGRGSEFVFTARFERNARIATSELPPPPTFLRGLRVLVVDDNAVNRQILEEWLREWKMEPTSVGDGVAAIDALWHGVSIGRPYALALLDSRMPDTDGLSLASKIRERSEIATTRLILLTSGDRPGDLERSRELRVDAHLLKPVPQDELLDAIHQTMNRTPGTTPDYVRDTPAILPDPVPRHERQRLRVLVAEDNQVNAQLIVQLMNRRGHAVEVANNGREALYLTEAGAFDVVLLDLNMPELDGFRVVETIRQREKATGDHLPIVALTARARPEDRDRCLAAGMDDFLRKPIDAVALWATVDRVVLSYRSRERLLGG
jgi:two-component system sensor histidine kinase/response regulator